MKDWIVSGLLLIVGLLNLTPVIVFFLPERTASLYGIDLAGTELTVLMRHRAILLGLLGAALIYAAFRRDVLVPVIIAAFIGKLAFLFLTYSSPGVNAEIGRVAVFDIVAVVLLAVALILHLVGSRP